MRKCTCRDSAATPPLNGTSGHELSDAVFKKVFSSVVKGSAAGVAGTTFENWHAIYQNRGVDDLKSLVSSIVAGKACDEIYDFLSASRIIALEKPNKDIRPIAIGDTLARLASKCICEARQAALAKYFTSTSSGDGSVPLQLGVGTPGGTEIAVHSARLLLETNPSWACCSGMIDEFALHARSATCNAASLAAMQLHVRHVTCLIA